MTTTQRQRLDETLDHADTSRSGIITTVRFAEIMSSSDLMGTGAGGRSSSMGAGAGAGTAQSAAGPGPGPGGDALESRPTVEQV